MQIRCRLGYNMYIIKPIQAVVRNYIRNRKFYTLLQQLEDIEFENIPNTYFEIVSGKVIFLYNSI